MPLYELRCINKECEFEFEDQVKLEDVDNIKCPKCGTTAIREFRTNPKHAKHSSATTWRMNNGH
jgi:putative FmdB family regulatory protein